MQDLAAIIVMVMIGVVTVSYLIGSIPFGVVITRAAGAGDVRAIGSGNIGATNVLRTGRRDLAIATLVLDAGKGAFCFLMAKAILGGDLIPALAGGAAFLGHLFPVWLKFKGGKGVATFFGLVLAAAWPLGLIAAVIWLVMAAVFRFSSLASLTAATVTPVIALLPLGMLGLPAPWALVGMLTFCGVLIWIRHAENIGRLLKGTESRLGQKAG
ncbi:MULTISPECIES: glycerol-3-phosphate 1-O-acyltransferase PlsY [Brevundimonas]|uniref:glycerol-3-phosphate 1-O-acyltransferase PlsY n=1 Tax=Brevundimonas TaxID=41275 RepID=UPI001F0BDE36|nr:glycerol-3-phosphate 1-O-acyltransferase PlsY [Brevundimonas lutea]